MYYFLMFSLYTLFYLLWCFYMFFVVCFLIEQFFWGFFLGSRSQTLTACAVLSCWVKCSVAVEFWKAQSTWGDTTKINSFKLNLWCAGKFWVCAARTDADTLIHPIRSAPALGGINEGEIVFCCDCVLWLQQGRGGKQGSGEDLIEMIAG